MKKKTFYIFGTPFTFSLSRVKSWGSQLAHFWIHFAVALASPEFSMGGALFVEVRDGEQGHLETWKEGFNIFPDFLFRTAGVVAGYFGRKFIEVYL